ncbi:MAG: serine hydrolase domain-containing protein [Pyrinomonadaceae bacterium]
MRKLTSFIIIGLILFSSARGQVPALPATTNREGDTRLPADSFAPGVHDLTAADLEAFLDGIVPQQLERENIAGATIAVVKDGKLLFARGYGYSDVTNKKPVSAEETLFRPGSVSKLFTWTAVMQLHEQGKLDLDRDVNEYLDFKIPDVFGQPITLKHIMTHTAGFEEQVKDLFTVGSDSPNLGEYLKTHIPSRIYPPGTVPAYSNYATALAGYIVELVSGRPFNDYIAENIFQMLGMSRSTFVQPLPQEFVPGMSNGYRLASDDEPVSFEVVVPFPAGSLSSTATDMAKFILAHLKEGQFGDARILRPETVRLMHSGVFALDPAANAMAYGFYEESKNGHRIIGHAGDTIAFHSDLHLIPDTGVGFFVSYNSGGKGEISPRAILWDAFLDRYFPFTPSAQPTWDSTKENAKAVSGTYMLSRRGDTSFLKVASILGEATVSAREDGTIEIAALTEPSGQPKRWREVAPMTFRDVNGQDILIFKPDANGNMQIILPYPFMVFQRVGLLQNSTILLPILGISLLIMLLTLVLAPIAWMVRKHYDHKLELSPLERKLRIGVWVVFALDLIFVVAFVGFVTYASSHIQLLSDSGNIWIYLIQTIGILGAIGTLVVLYNAINSWMSKRRIWSKLQATLLVLACLGFLWFAFAGNLLIFSSNY